MTDDAENKGDMPKANFVEREPETEGERAADMAVKVALAMVRPLDGPVSLSVLFTILVNVLSDFVNPMEMLDNLTGPALREKILEVWADKNRRHQEALAAQSEKDSASTKGLLH